jgi:uncharacterized short protein YbdD (DUF466 family)
VAAARTPASLLTRVTMAAAAVAAAVRRIVGVPDYDAYVRHVRAHHPGDLPPTREQFLQQCWEQKYSKPGNRCC